MCLPLWVALYSIIPSLVKIGFQLAELETFLVGWVMVAGSSENKANLAQLGLSLAKLKLG